MKINWKNILIYTLSILIIGALAYYLFVLPKLSTGESVGTTLKGLYGY